MAANKQYRAFISYSQQDGLWGKRIHRWLEDYRVPVGSLADIQMPRRLGKFFRDDEDMAAASDIAEIVRGAIEDAESLIVICSPRSAKSKWVNAEIQHFRRTGRARKVFAVIIDGIPNSGDEQTECFPPALRAAGDPSDPDALPIEPLGLDIRKDGRSRACTRLAAGLLGIDFDDLWQRDRRRVEMRQRLLIGSLASIGIVFAAISAAAIGFALQARERAAILSIDAARASLAEGQTDAALLILLEAAKQFRNSTAPDDLLIVLDEALQRAAAETVHRLPENARLFDAPAGFYIYDPSADTVLLLDSVSQPRLVASDAGDPLYVGEAPSGALILVRRDLTIESRTKERSEKLGAFKTNDEIDRMLRPGSSYLQDDFRSDWTDGISPDGVLSFAGQHFDLETKRLHRGLFDQWTLPVPQYVRQPNGERVVFAQDLENPGPEDWVTRVRELDAEGVGRIRSRKTFVDLMRYKCWGTDPVGADVERQFDVIVMEEMLSVECTKSGEFLLLSLNRSAAGPPARHDYLFFLGGEGPDSASRLESDLAYGAREYSPLVQDILADALRSTERSFVSGGAPKGLLQRQLRAVAIAAVPENPNESQPWERILAVTSDRDVVVDTPELTYYWRMSQEVVGIRLLPGLRAAVLDADLGAIRVLDFRSPHLHATRQADPHEIHESESAHIQAELDGVLSETRYVGGMTVKEDEFDQATYGASIVSKEGSVYRRLGSGYKYNLASGILPAGEFYVSANGFSVAISVHTLDEAVEAAKRALSPECLGPPVQSYRASPCWPKRLAN